MEGMLTGSQGKSDSDPICPLCQSGHLLRVRANGKSAKKFHWLCSDNPKCKYYADDVKGVPLGKYSCGCCGRPLLKVTTLEPPYWVCTASFDRDHAKRCEKVYEDVEGAPVK